MIDEMKEKGSKMATAFATSFKNFLDEAKKAKENMLPDEMKQKIEQVSEKVSNSEIV